MSRYVAILVDEASARCPQPIDRGWRLRVEYDPDYSGRVAIVEEQVLPECVLKIDANRIRAENGRVELDLDEARWMRDQLSLVIERMARDDEELDRYLRDRAASEVSR